VSALPRILIIGGYDPSGAGLEADRAALAGLEVESWFVATASTDQDDREVRSIGAREAEDWMAEAVGVARKGIAAVKFGLLPGVEHVIAARDLLRQWRAEVGGEFPAVVDPVIRASSGGTFLDPQAVLALRRELVAQGVILTPNLAEAAELTGTSAGELEASLEARLDAAAALLAAGAAAVVVKGGHGREDPACDLVATRGRAAWIARRRIAGGWLRGSGCRFASRLAAGMALGAPLEAAAEEAGRFVAGEIARAARAAGPARG
jgi:hydroxymethylpyrimidine/phosphomethylpyrimidine kinase